MGPVELAEKVQRAGVAGAGGAGFPTHVKLNGKNIDTYLINCAECEPLLENNMATIDEEAEFLVNTAQEVGQALGASCVFCIKKKHVAQVKLLERHGATVFGMEDYYPAGDEIVMIQEATGRTVPEGKLPLSVGVVVNNVETLYNIGRAIKGLPVTFSWVTVGGAVSRPGVWKVPLGTSASDLIDLAGGVTVDDPVFIDGGPMTGQYREKPDFVINKRSNGVLVIPSSLALFRYENLPVEFMLKRARVACCQCTQCTLVCSRNLIGYKIEPHKIMRAMAYPSQRTPEILKMALLCSDCNLCSGLHACPMQLSPRRVNQEIKKSFRANGVRYDLEHDVKGPVDQRESRLLPTGRLLRRIGLARWNVKTPFMGDITPERVKVPLLQHIGASCVSVLSTGDMVEAGQLLGTVPEGALGVPVHCPVSGKVVFVDDNFVEIETIKE